MSYGKKADQQKLSDTVLVWKKSKREAKALEKEESKSNEILLGTTGGKVFKLVDLKSWQFKEVEPKIYFFLYRKRNNIENILNRKLNSK